MKLTSEIVLKYANTKGNKLRSDDSPEVFLKRLTHLNLPEKSIDEIGDDLSICSNLSVIYLYDNLLSKIANLDFALNLTHLYLQNNNIQRIEGLSNCTNIEKLYLSNNAIIVVEGLHTLVSLRELCIDCQKLPPGEKLIFEPRTVVNISRTLEVLNVAGNNLDTVRELRCMVSMRHLNVSNNKIGAMKDLADTIASMNYLYKLDAHGNPIVRKAKYRDRVITMNDKIRVLDGKEVPDSLKSFLRNWKSAKDKQKKMLIDQAMTDGIPDLPPLQKVPLSGHSNKYANNEQSHSAINGVSQANEVLSSGKVRGPPIKRGMRSGQKEIEQIIAKSQLGHHKDEDQNRDGNPTTGGDSYNQRQDEMPLLALTDPQGSHDSNFVRQTTNVMDIEVRTPDLPPTKSANYKTNQSPNVRRSSGQVQAVKQQVMDFTNLETCPAKGGVGDSVGGIDDRQMGTGRFGGGLRSIGADAGFNRDDVKLDLR